MSVAWPPEVGNFISGREQPAIAREWLDKLNPADGALLCRVARSRAADAEAAVTAAVAAHPDWSSLPPVQRGMQLHELVRAMQDSRDAIARAVAADTGKSLRDARAETTAAIAAGFFFAGEGQRLYGRTTTSGIPNRQAMTVRQPIGVAGLIVPANTPIANIAWKVFPALICGNSAVLKAAEHAPLTAWTFARLAQAAGLPDGVLGVLHGYGPEAGMPLAHDRRVGVVSFTGSTAAGLEIQKVAGARLARVSLELGGKNPFVVCDDAELAEAARWATLSAFSNAGQRCASASRIIVFDAVYESFMELLVERTRNLRVGTGDDDDFGPVISAEALERLLEAIGRAESDGARVLIGGHRVEGNSGYFLSPTLIEAAGPGDEISTTELFGPVACIYRVGDFDAALALANDSPYGLTACVHTGNIHRAMEFARRAEAGVVVVNAGTFGSEPHMPFGGIKQSGNGSREPGTEALDVYSYLKDIYVSTDPDRV